MAPQSHTTASRSAAVANWLFRYNEPGKAASPAKTDCHLAKVHTCSHPVGSTEHLDASSAILPLLHEGILSKTKNGFRANSLWECEIISCLEESWSKLATSRKDLHCALGSSTLSMRDSLYGEALATGGESCGKGAFCVRDIDVFHFTTGRYDLGYSRMKRLAFESQSHLPAKVSCRFKAYESGYNLFGWSTLNVLNFLPDYSDGTLLDSVEEM